MTPLFGYIMDGTDPELHNWQSANRTKAARMADEFAITSRIRASYHPASMLIRHLRITLENFFRKYRLDEARDRPNSYIQTWTDYVHEYIHFMQLAGTAYGQFETVWRTYQVSLLRDVFHAVAAIPLAKWPLPPHLPLQNWCSHYHHFGPLLSEDVRLSLDQWINIERLFSVLRGDVPINRGVRHTISEFLNVEPTDQPIIMCAEGHEHTFGTHAILETAAVHFEYAAKMTMRPPRSSWNMFK